MHAICPNSLKGLLQVRQLFNLKTKVNLINLYLIYCIDISET